METEEGLKIKINSIIRNNLRFRRDIIVISVTREMDEPKISGSHPVVVTFLRFQDKEEVLKKAGLLVGTNVHIMEDICMRTKESN